MTSRIHQGDPAHPHCLIDTVSIVDKPNMPARRRLVYLRDNLMQLKERGLGVPDPPTSGTWVAVTGVLEGTLEYKVEDDWNRRKRLHAFLNERIQSYSNLGVDAVITVHLNYMPIHPAFRFLSVPPPGQKAPDSG